MRHARQIHLLLLFLTYFKSSLSTLSIRQRCCLITLHTFYCCTGITWNTAAARGEHCALQAPRKRLFCSVRWKFSRTFSLLKTIENYRQPWAPLTVVRPFQMPTQIEQFPLTSGSLICARTLGTRGKKNTHLSNLATKQSFSHQNCSFSVASICCQISAQNFNKLSPP